MDKKPDARRDAKELSRSLAMLARQLDALYRGIIAPNSPSLSILIDASPS